MSKSEQTLTVALLKRELENWSDDTEIDFGVTMSGSPLTFYRFKNRDENILQIELNDAAGG